MCSFVIILFLWAMYLVHPIGTIKFYTVDLIGLFD